MAQYIYPDGDVTTDSWTTTPLFEKIDEGATPDDGDYIQGPASVGGTSEVSLANPASAPTGSTATVRIRVAVNKTNKSGTMIVRLREGTTQRGASATLDAQVDFAAASTFYDFNFSATSIGNYDNLNIQFDQVTATGGNFFMVSWAECETPDGAPGGTNFTQDVAGSFSAVGTYSFLLSAARTGQASFNADIARQISKSFVGSATLNGTVARRVATSLVGSFDGTGDVAAKSVTRRTVTGILGQSGAVVRQTAHTLSGSLRSGSHSRASSLRRQEREGRVLTPGHLLCGGSDFTQGEKVVVRWIHLLRWPTVRNRRRILPVHFRRFHVFGSIVPIFYALSYFHGRSGPYGCRRKGTIRVHYRLPGYVWIIGQEGLQDSLRGADLLGCPGPRDGSIACWCADIRCDRGH
jgi:hypothetical protein